MALTQKDFGYLDKKFGGIYKGQNESNLKIEHIQTSLDAHRNAPCPNIEKHVKKNHKRLNAAAIIGIVTGIIIALIALLTFSGGQ